MTRLQTAELCLRMAWFKAKRGHPMPTKADARDLLAELGVNGAARETKRPGERKALFVWTHEQLAALPERAVIRDAEERVLERWPMGWWMTGVDPDDGPPDVDLPARVLYTPEDGQR